MGRSTFQNEWLEMPEFCKWLAKHGHDRRKGYCKVCAKDFDVSGSGICQVRSHAKSTKHKERMQHQNSTLASVGVRPTSKSDKSSLSTPKQSASARPTSQSVFMSSALAESVQKAELLSCLKLVRCHHSFRSQNEDDYQEMFTDSAIAENYSCAETKSRYLVTHGLGPYFHQQLRDSVKGLKYVLMFDETMNVKNQLKQLDLYVRYWDPTENIVMSRYWQSTFLGHSRATDLASKILTEDVKLPVSDMIQLSMDGPSVNWKLHDMIEEHLQSNYNQKLINIGEYLLLRPTLNIF